MKVCVKFGGKKEETEFVTGINMIYEQNEYTMSKYLKF